MTGQRAPGLNADSGLRAERVVVRVDGALLIDGVDCTAPAGTFSALIGPNGAGKSTLLHVLAGVGRPSAGVIRFGENDLHQLARRARARITGFVEQDAMTELGLSVREVVGLGRLPFQSLFGAESADDARVVEEAITRTGVEELATRDVTTLSGGERQRVLLAKALAQESRLLLLDEPTNHLDIGAQLAVLTLLTELATGGVTVLAALHDLTLAAAWSDHVIVLDAGTVVAAGPTAATLTPELIGAVYGVDARILEHPDTGRPVIAFSPRP